MAVANCAIYTRKSTEEGLSQAFNSLEAQREAGEAYIASQREQGWVALPERYDDGGFTGANMERPALNRLLADIDAGRIHCVLVYKVDRLSRSLLDFARILGRFEQQGVSFVSVTQQFNTSLSLGRLTLNMLLSFAQFEREMIAERTRDKMAAARRKGKWVGGIPVLGYDIASQGGKLVVNAAEAQQVRNIFELYLANGSVPEMLRRLDQHGWKTKQWTTRSGKLYGGHAFNKNTLKALLGNVIYTGRVRCDGQLYEGEHDAIVDRELWNAVNQRAPECVPCMEESRVASARATQAATPAEPISKPCLHIGKAGSAARKLPRIARLLALAIKLEELVRQGVVRDYAELARLGHVTRARITQIVSLCYLAPDIQEAILFAEGQWRMDRVGESKVRPIAQCVDWDEQRRLWQHVVPTDDVSYTAHGL